MSNANVASESGVSQSKRRSRNRRRLRIYFAMLLFVAVGTFTYIKYYLDRPVGSGPAGPEVAAKPFQETWTERKVHLLGIGDSITRGLGAKSSKHSYFERLIRNPEDEYADMQGKCLSVVLPNLSSQNISVSGSTSLHHVEHINDRLTPFADDVFGLVVMTTGGNDIIHNYGRTPPSEGAMYNATLEQAEPWIENFETRLNGMLDKINELFPGGCEVYLADIYDPTDGIGDAPSIMLKHWEDGLAIHAEYNRVLGKVAAERDNVFPVPLHAEFLGHGAHCVQFWREHYHRDDPSYWFYTNVEDPNDRGYDAIRRVFLNTISGSTGLRSEKHAEL